MSWFSRFFFVVVAFLAVLGLWTEQGCTRRGGSGGSAPPTAAPQTTFYVNPVKGNDTTGNGEATTPFKSITRALVAVSKSTATGLTISLSSGTYTAASGEVFPIVIPVTVSISGTIPVGRRSFSFISGYGEDKALETALGAPAGSYFTTVAVPSSVSAALNNVYVGSQTVNLKGGRYDALDVLGSVQVSHGNLG
ncbi:MAG: DUF1565 domain-containing protein, partial [Candidatus Eremiobacteraeota bacterium]|nr:DUF1565 domain-containing protein [Candidatus Eremiobacteraeota bacterium]